MRNSGAAPINRSGPMFRFTPKHSSAGTIWSAAAPGLSCFVSNGKPIVPLRLTFAIIALLILSSTLNPSAAAQDNYEIQVYGYDMVEPHHTMIELHSNFTIDGSKTIQDGILPTNHAVHETIEITHGFTDWFETGFYIFTYQRNGNGFQWVGDHIRPRVRIPPKWKCPVTPTLSHQISSPTPNFSTHPLTYPMLPLYYHQ